MRRASVVGLCVGVLGCAGPSPVEGTLGAGVEHGASTGETRGDESEDDAALASTGTDAPTPDVGTGTGTEGTSGALDEDEPEPAPCVAVVPGRTQDAERVATLAVARSEADAERRVVLRLAPDELPPLARGDRLATPAEVQVTTRCDLGQSAPGCGYDPRIRAQLVLTGDPDGTDPSDAEARTIGPPQTQTCTRGEHHCMFVFRPEDATLVLDDVPCVDAGDCHVNLVMWAWDPDARSGGQDVVLVGENEGDFLQNGLVGGDKARLMAVRERAIADADRDVQLTETGGALAVPTDASPTVVYSHRIADALAQDEQVLIEAAVVTAVGGRARVSSKLIVSTDPDATEGGAPDGITPRELGEHNGINCTAGQSPCTTRKVAVLRATADVDGPLFVNVVVRSAVPGGGSTSVTVQRGAGFVRSTRWGAAHRG